MADCRSKSLLIIALLGTMVGCKKLSPMGDDADVLQGTLLSGNVCEEAGSPANKKYCYYMLAHHRSVVAAATQEYSRAEYEGGRCALTQATGLEMSGVISPFRLSNGTRHRPASTIKLAAALTSGGEGGGAYWEGKGWRKVGCHELKAGDIVLTTPAVPGGGVYYHSFMFLKFVASKADAIQGTEAASGQKRGSVKLFYPESGEEYLAWALDYHNPEQALLDVKAYIRWINFPFGKTIPRTDPPIDFAGDNLCAVGLRGPNG